MDERAIRARLDDCLIDDYAYAAGTRGWALLDDPFPPWDAIESRHHAS